jgi:hypothetical protein
MKTRKECETNLKRAESHLLQLEEANASQPSAKVNATNSTVGAAAAPSTSSGRSALAIAPSLPVPDNAGTQSFVIGYGPAMSAANTGPVIPIAMPSLPVLPAASTEGGHLAPVALVVGEILPANAATPPVHRIPTCPVPHARGMHLVPNPVAGIIPPADTITLSIPTPDASVGGGHFVPAAPVAEAIPPINTNAGCTLPVVIPSVATSSGTLPANTDVGNVPLVVMPSVTAPPIVNAKESHPVPATSATDTMPLAGSLDTQDSAKASVADAPSTVANTSGPGKALGGGMPTRKRKRGDGKSVEGEPTGSTVPAIEIIDESEDDTKVAKTAKAVAPAAPVKKKDDITELREYLH